MEAPAKLLILDCDSTLSAIEGIDELARLRGPECFREIEHMTREAMEGRIPLESVFGRRLEIIQPRLEEARRVGALYLREVEPTARETIAAAKAAGWAPVIVSGGFLQAIRPLADFLGIARIEAVELRFDAAGRYAGYTPHPATRKGGKPEVARRLRAELKPARIVAVGDGASDLELRDEVDLFVGFGRYAERPAVQAGAHRFVRRLDEILPLLARCPDCSDSFS
ncbi:MAG: haloacid dehalogenase [Opitutus sp.]|nr:haloacid dehalogenase [Opitutus sp.]